MHGKARTARPIHSRLVARRGRVLLLLGWDWDCMAAVDRSLIYQVDN
jgi:hypothetical protein